MVELRHLRTLIALRDSGSLVEAADRVHLTQSALSHQLKDLEDRLGCNLFIRKSRPLRFTVAGERLLQLADDVLPAIRSAEREIGKLADGQAGRLHMAIECHSCFQWLMPSIDRFRNHWPEVELDLSSGFNFAPLPALMRGELDLVITSDPVDLKGLSYVALFGYETLLAVGKDHRLAEKKHIDPDDLNNETLITYPVSRDRLDIFTQFLDKSDAEPANIRTAELTMMMVQLVATGRGVCSLPNWALTEYLEKQYVLAKPLGEDGIWCTLYAAVRSEQLDAPFIRDFLQTAKETSFATLTGIKEREDVLAF